MSYEYTSSNLIDIVKRKCAIPSSQQLVTDADICEIASEEMYSVIVPLIMSYRQQYFITYSDTTVTSATTYDIPANAIGNAIREIEWIDSNDNSVNIPQISLEEISRNPAICGFYFKGSQVVMYPEPNVGDTLRIWYYKRPLRIIPEINAGQITSISGNDLTLSNVPSSWSTGTIELVSPSPNFTGYQATMSAASSPTVTVSDNSDCAEGQWVSLESYSPVVQLFPEAFNLLCSAVSIKIFEHLKDTKGFEMASEKFKLEVELFASFVSPRAVGQVRKVKSRWV